MVEYKGKIFVRDTTQMYKTEKTTVIIYDPASPERMCDQTGWIG